MRCGFFSVLQRTQKFFAGLLFPFWRLRLQIVNGPCAIRVDLLYFPVSVSSSQCFRLWISTDSVTVSLYYYVFIIRTGSLLSGFIRLLMPLVFQRGFLFSSISTFWRSIARLATCRFIFFHFFHSYTLIIRYDLPPDPWSDLPKVLLCFLFLFFYVVSMFGFLLCCVGFGFTFIGVWHRRDGFFMGYMGWYQIRLDSSTSRSNHFIAITDLQIIFVTRISPVLYYSTQE